MLTLFARIRGLRSSENRINEELEKLASFVDLSQYLDRPCGQYSGGNKRKLNVALALIGRYCISGYDDIQCIRKKCKTTVYVPHYQEEECFGLYEGSLRDILRAEGNLEDEGDVQLNTSQLKAVYGHLSS